MSPLWWGAAAASALYVALAVAGVKGPLVWVKVLPGLLLAALCAPVSLLVAAGMVASAVGDAFLLDKDRYFLHGLAAFLVGHLCFVPGFLEASGQAPSGGYTAGVLGAVAVATAVLRPRSGRLRYAVPVYALALGAMAIAASSFGPLGIAGGLAFVVSDALLAIDKFKRPVPARALLVNSTYFGALLALSAAVVGA